MRAYPPTAGGPIYWWLRNRISTGRRKYWRLMRAYDFNWDVCKTICNGIPRMSYNPSVNEWVWTVDTDLWNGAGGKAWFFITGQLSVNLFWAYAMYTIYQRWHVNSKIDMFSKWRNHPTE